MFQFNRLRCPLPDSDSDREQRPLIYADLEVGGKVIASVTGRNMKEVEEAAGAFIDIQMAENYADVKDLTE